MARLPSWRQELPVSLSSARKWGTGVNPIHATHDPTTVGRQQPTRDPLISSPYVGLQDDIIVGYDDMAFSDAPPMEGMSETTEHPNWGNEGENRAVTQGYPVWGPGGYPVPQGTVLRSQKRAMGWREGHVNAQVQGDAGDGWINKEFDPKPLDSKPSDPSQYEIWTSMSQRDQIRTNAAATMRGTDDPREPIPSRIIGMKKKTWPGGIRHEDMMPRQQNGPYRPFRFRTAGTGPWQQWNGVNEMYVSEPIQRSLPPDVNMGQTESTYSAGEDLYGEDFYYG